jgi:hypothetical protein
MNLEENFYFRNMKHYFPKGINYIYSAETLKDINDLSTKIRNTAKYALLEEISPNNAKKEITNLLKTIKLIKEKAK